jgi:SHS2 domain-containing protein
VQTDRHIKLPAELWSRMADAAQAEGKTVEELFEEAALRLLKLRELRSFVAGNRELATELGLAEADVPRLIAESRTERPGR